MPTDLCGRISRENLYKTVELIPLYAQFEMCKGKSKWQSQHTVYTKFKSIQI